MDMESTKRDFSNVLRVAAELAGKGTKKGEMGLDEIEAVGPSVEKEAVAESSIEEDVQTFAQMVLEELIAVEENLDFELVDEDLDFAIENIIENLLSLQEDNKVKIHKNGKGLPKGAVRSDTAPKGIIPSGHRSVHPNHIGRKGVNVASYMDTHLGKERPHVTAFMPTKQAKKVGEETAASMRSSGDGRID